MPDTKRTVAVELQAQVSGFVAGFKTAQKQAGEFSSKLQKSVLDNRSSLHDLSTNFGILGAGMVAAAGFAVKAFADFDAAMSNVQAATHESAANMDLLRDAALTAGERTKYSATEAAGAIESLAKAGVSTADILGGGLDGALDLAAAGNIEVADAADIAATAMTQFGLSGGQIPHVADLLAAAAGKAQGDVADMSAALKQSGLVASQMGLSIEETTGTLAAFASAGLLGSDAGTSFRTMLLRLANPSGEAAEKMAELGVSAYDASGNFVGMSNFAGQLHKALAPLPQAERDAALAIIFGSDAIRGANVLYDQGAKGITDWIAKVDDSGYAAETAAIKMDNLRGDLETFLGSLQTALIGVGEGADGPMRDLVQSATGVVNAFNDMPGPIKEATLLLVGGGGLVLLGIAGMARLAVSIAETRVALTTLGITAGRVGTILKFVGVAGAIGGVAYAAVELGDAMSKITGTPIATDLDDMSRAMLKLGRSGEVSGALVDTFGENFGGVVRRFQADGKSFGEMANYLANRTWLDKIEDNLNDTSKSFDTMDAALANLVESGHAEAANKAFDRLAATAEKSGVDYNQLLELFPRYLQTQVDAADKANQAADAQGKAARSTKDYGNAAGDAAGKVRDLEKEANDLIDALNTLTGTNLDAVETGIAFRGAVRDLTGSVKENGRTIKAGTEAGDANIEMLNRGIRAAMDNADAVSAKTRQDKGADEAGRAWTGTMARNIRQLLNEADQLGLNEQETRRYIARILGVPVKSLTKFTTPGLIAALENSGQLKANADSLDGREVTTKFTSVRQIINARPINQAPIGIRAPKQARGGAFATGSWSWVGEEGPELVRWGRQGTVIPHQRSMRLADANPVRSPAGHASSSAQRAADQITNHFHMKDLPLTEQAYNRAVSAAALRARVGRPS